MRRSIDGCSDDHPMTSSSADGGGTSWVVWASDDCEECEDPRIVLGLEGSGTRGLTSAHLAPATARRLRAALAAALREIGEPDS